MTRESQTIFFIFYQNGICAFRTNVLFSANCLSVLEHFLGLALKGVSQFFPVFDN